MAVEASLSMLASLMSRTAKSGAAKMGAFDSSREDDNDDGSSISLSEREGGATTSAGAGVLNSAGLRVGRAASKLNQFSFPSQKTPRSPGPILRGEGVSDDDDDGGSWYTATPGHEVSTAVKQPPQASLQSSGMENLRGGPGREALPDAGGGATTVLAEKLLDMRQRAEKWKARCGQLGDQLAALGGSMAAKVGVGPPEEALG